MSLRREWSLFFLVFVCLSFPASAKVCIIETFKIRNMSGIVLDEHGGALANAQVVVSKIKGRAIDHTLTDVSGTFNLRNIPDGKYELRVQALGFEDGQLLIVLNRPKTKMNASQVALRIVLTLGMGCTSASLVNKGDPRRGQYRM
jgi:hypothetical protein